MNKQGGLKVCANDSSTRTGFFLVKEFDYSKPYKKLCFFMPVFFSKKISQFSLAVFLFFILAGFLFPQTADARQYIVKSASEYDYPPFSIVTADGQADGFSVELLRASLAAVGREVDFYVGEWSLIKEDLTEGRIQVLPVVGRTPEREAIYDFTVPYMSIYGNIFVRSDNSNIKTLADLVGKEVLVMEGDNAEEFVRREKVSEKIVTTKTYEEAFNLLSEGKYDAIIAQSIVGKQIIKKLGIENVAVVGQLNNFKQDFTFAVKEGDGALLSLLNDGLSQVITNGKYDELYKKWLGDNQVEAGGKEIQETVKFAASSIQQKAMDVAKQIEIYLTLNRDKTIADLQKDEYFQQIAVQKVGETGYTAVTEYETLINRFHANSDIVDVDLATLAEKLPGFWSIMSRTRGGKEASGVYDWQEPDGTMKQKYMYISTVKVKTADGIGLNVAATAYLDEYGEKSSIKQKALEVAAQIETYFQANPQARIVDLQRDKFFKNIAVQTIEDSGYTAVMDVRSGLFYFHPQERLVNTSAEALREKLPDWWKIFKATMDDNCRGASGVYDWTEADGAITKKFMATACVNIPSGDGKYLFVAATDYVNKADGARYIETYKIEPGFSYSKDAINQRAQDIAKQIELYIKANPQKTLGDLKQDKEFQSLAIQQVGKTGYTYLITHETGILDFHPDPKIQNSSYDSFKADFPVIWEIINKSVQSKPCADSSGFYDWADINGLVRDKYTYHRCVEAKTADGFSFFIGASAYLDEYQQIDTAAQVQAEPEIKQSYPLHAGWLYGFLVLAIISIAILHLAGAIRLDGPRMLLIIALFFVLISILFIVSSFMTVDKLRTAFYNSYVKEHLQLANLRSQQFSEQIDQMGAELKFLASIESQTSAQEHDLFGLLRNAFERSDKHVYASYRINKDGLISNMFPIDEKSLGADISEQEHIIKIKKTLKPVLSNVFDAVEGFRGVTLHYPVIKNGEYDGTVAFLINIDDMLDSLVLFYDRQDSTENFLLDGQHNIVLAETRAYLGKNIQELEEYASAKNVFEKISIAAAGGYEVLRVNGKELTIVYQPIVLEDNIWFLLSRESSDDIYQGMDSALNNIWFFTFLTLFSIAVLGFFASYLLTNSLRQEVKKQTEVVQQKAEQIKMQLKREAEISREKEGLLIEQQKAKKELEEKIAELEKFQAITIDREIKMIELKKRIAELK